MILCGERISAAKALEIGLVEEVLSLALLSSRPSSRPAPGPRAQPRSLPVLLIHGARNITAGGLAAERSEFVNLFSTEDQREGVNASLRSARLNGKIARKRVSEWIGGTSKFCSGPAGRRLTLNAPKTEFPTRDMVEVLSDRLMAWRDDAAIAAVVIDGAGDKAFCAGGDVQALRDSSIEPPVAPVTMRRIFRPGIPDELHLTTYPKPAVCWGTVL